MPTRRGKAHANFIMIRYKPGPLHHRSGVFSRAHRVVVTVQFSVAVHVTYQCGAAICGTALPGVALKAAMQRTDVARPFDTPSK